MGDICEFGDALRNVIAKTSYCRVGVGGGGTEAWTLHVLAEASRPGYIDNLYLIFFLEKYLILFYKVTCLFSEFLDNIL
jgi:hypothetical protein